jgi:hypothetical protein
LVDCAWGGARNCEDQDHQGGWEALDVPLAHVSADRAEEVKREADGGRDAQRGVPEPHQHAGRARDLAGGQEREDAKRDTDAGEAVDDALVLGELGISGGDQRQRQQERDNGVSDDKANSRLLERLMG